MRNMKSIFFKRVIHPPPLGLASFAQKHWHICDMIFVFRFIFFSSSASDDDVWLITYYAMLTRARPLDALRREGSVLKREGLGAVPLEMRCLDADRGDLPRTGEADDDPVRHLDREVHEAFKRERQDCGPLGVARRLPALVHAQ